MPDFAQMHTFVLTADLGSLAAVAKKLNVSPAAISKQLTKLEEELGVQLLVRTTRRIELTDVGVHYCVQCRRILEEVEEAQSLVSQVKAEPSGPLKVITNRYFAHTYIVPHMKEFLTKYPKVRLNLEIAERIPDFQTEDIDVLIGMNLSATGDPIQKRITTTAYTYCASPQYLKKFGTPKKPQHLIDHRYITHSMRKPDHVLQFNDKVTVTVQPYMHVNDAETMLQFALDGLGIVKLHQYMVQEQIHRGKLVELLKSFHHSEIPLYVSYPQRRFVSSKIRCFIDFIEKKIH